MSHDSPSLIFVTGASRSGTTLMSVVLGKNSQILCMNETHFFGECWDPRSLADDFSEGSLEHATATLFARLERGILKAQITEEDRGKARTFLAGLPAQKRNPADVYLAVVTQTASDAGKAIPCEQTPRNIFYARRLLELYPSARVVHMIRDPRAVMASQKKRWRRRQLAAVKLPFYHTVRVWANYHPTTMSQLWRRATAQALKLQSESHERFLAVRFEDLLREPEPTVRKVCDFLGVTFEPTMLNVGQINSSHQSSVGGARPGLNKGAIDAWREVLSAGEIAITEQVCSAEMQSCGYNMDVPQGAGLATKTYYGLTYLFHALSVAATNPRRALIQFKAAFRG